MPNAEYAPIHELAKSIASILGPDWAYDAKGSTGDGGVLYRGANIVGPDGMRLWIARGDGADRAKLGIHGECEAVDALGKPKRVYDFHGVKRPPTIYVNPDRGADVIAREIKRRFMPEYMSSLTEFKERMASHNAYVATKANVIGILADELGSKPIPHMPDTIVDYESGEGRIEARVEGSEVHLEFSRLTVDEALAVIRACKAAKAKRELNKEEAD